MNDFLPVSRKDMDEKGIEQLDFIFITGDSYVDHPSFGVAIISRVLEFNGFSVGIIAQPNWRNNGDFEKMGVPKLAYLVTSGNIDSMVAHYTVAKRVRSTDAYTAGNVMGKRPDRAVIVYSQKLKELHPEIPVLIGGLEASLRRFAHYDYWDDAVRPSILVDSKADILMFGMSEHQIVEIANRLKNGEKVKEINDIRGTAFLTKPVNTPFGAVECPNLDQVSTNKGMYAKACKIQYDQQDEIYGKTIIQRHGGDMLVQNPPALSLSQDELDAVYLLPFTGNYHPMYEKLGGVPAIEEVQFSITHNRGCFGHCNFCSIALHQGRKISSRSEQSVIDEAIRLTQKPNFKGYIHDVGGPTANFRKPSCEKQLKLGLCKGKKCLAPTPCPALEVDHSEYLGILRKIRAIKGIKKVFIRSGIRYDYLIEDKNEEFMRELIEHHVSGQLKVAPEHCSAVVLDKMGKPHIEAYKTFSEKFYQITKQKGKEQYLVPYLMSSHPGSRIKDAIELALFLKSNNIRPEQVQDFYPTPGTISTCMFYSGLDPYTMEEVYVAKSSEEKAMQRALLQYFVPKNQRLVIQALQKSGRTDLIGNDKKCLVSPDKDFLLSQRQKQQNQKGRNEKWGQNTKPAKRK